MASIIDITLNQSHKNSLNQIFNHLDGHTLYYAIPDIDIFHGAVLRMNSNHAFLWIAVEALERRFIIDECYNDVSIISCLLLTHNDKVTFHDPSLDHGFTVSVQDEEFTWTDY